MTGEGTDYSHLLTERDKRVGRWIAVTANLAMFVYPVWEIVSHLTIHF